MITNVKRHITFSINIWGNLAVNIILYIYPQNPGKTQRERERYTHIITERESREIVYSIEVVVGSYVLWLTSYLVGIKYCPRKASWMSHCDNSSLHKSTHTTNPKKKKKRDKTKLTDGKKKSPDKKSKNKIRKKKWTVPVQVANDTLMYTYKMSNMLK